MNNSGQVEGTVKIFFLSCLFIAFWHRVSLGSPAWPGAHCAELAESILTHSCHKAVSYVCTISSSISPSHCQFAILPGSRPFVGDMMGGHNQLSDWVHQRFRSFQWAAAEVTLGACLLWQFSFGYGKVIGAPWVWAGRPVSQVRKRQDGNRKKLKMSLHGKGSVWPE